MEQVFIYALIKTFIEENKVLHLIEKLIFYICSCSKEDPEKYKPIIKVIHKQFNNKRN